MNSTNPKLIGVTRTIHPVAVQRLKSWCHQTGNHFLLWEKDSPPSNEQLRRFASDVDALITMITEKIDSELLSQCPKLKVIANHAVGVDNIDIKAAKHKGILIGNTPDVLTEATAELGVALTLATVRNFKKLQKYVESDQWSGWNPLSHLGLQLGEVTALKIPVIGIFGLGRIGRRIAEIFALGFRAKVAYTNTQGPLGDLAFRAQYLTETQLIGQSDVLIVAAPLNPQTANFFNAERLGTMKKGSYFINIARGGLHNEQALLELLNSGHLAGVGLDVTQPEPASKATNPLIMHEKCMVLPHIGSATEEARLKMGLISVENVILALESGQVHHGP